MHPFILRPHRTMLGLSLPVLLSLIAEPLTGLVDTFFVARLGAQPLAGLGIATALLSSVLWIFNFVAIGTQTEVAHAHGSASPARMRHGAAVGVAVAACLGLVFSALAATVLDPAVAFMGGELEVASAARTYLAIRLLGAPATLVTLAGFGALRGVQDMRTPLAVAVGLNALNIVLDAVLIFGAGPIPAFGIAGAAWATTVSHWLGMVATLIAVRQRVGLSPSIGLRDAARLLVVGRDLFVRTGLLLLFLLVATRAANRIGAEAGAAHQAIRSVWIFTALLLDAYAATAQSLIGFFLGRAAIGEARRVAAVAHLWGVTTGLALATAMLLGTDAVRLLLVPPAAQNAFHAAWVAAALAQPLNAVSFVTDGVHWGTGDFRYLRNAMVLATLLGVIALTLPETAAPDRLLYVWLVTAAWITIRAVLGAVRIWPGIGHAPLRPAV